MATTFSTGTQSPTSHKTLEKIYEEAQSTGAICLCGRKLREYPKIAARYDLIDTISADLSKNRFAEIPKEICDHAMLEELNCYHNVIKSIPESICQLQNLTFLNLSRNQLAVIPPFISQLISLEVLIASHNKLISLPEEMGVLEKLMEIDVSCNEIALLPPQIGDLKSLKSLNVRRNKLLELPVEICKLSLRKIDFSNNRISTIPTVFRKIETLEEIVLENNPLTMPPAHLCTKGRKHIMKYLQIEAIKENRNSGVEAEIKRFVRKSLPVPPVSDEFKNFLESPEKRKRHTVLSSDSGYSTTDSIEKCGWSPSEANSDADRAKMLATRSAEPYNGHRPQTNGHVQSPTSAYTSPTSVKTSIPQNVYGQMSSNAYRQNSPHTYGQYGNNSNNNAGQYDSASYQGTSSVGPMVHRSLSNSSSENQNYGHNPYANSPSYNSNTQYSANHSVSNQPPSSVRQSSTYSSTANNYHGQYAASSQYQSPGQQPEPKSNTPTSPPGRYSQSHHTSFQYSSSGSHNGPYRIIPPPVVTSNTAELSPEPSPNSPRTPKTPTPGYYQGGPGYSPSYSGYSTGSNSPNMPLTPQTPSNPHSTEDEISRELQRQQSEYNRKKQQAEQIKMQYEEDMRRREEEEEKENCRRAALKIQEEQRLLMEEERQREEARIQEERRQQEEAHRKEEQRKRDEAIFLEEQRRQEEEKQKQEAQQYKVENNYGYNQGWHDNRTQLRYNGHTADSYSMHFRKPGLKTSTGATKEEKKTSNLSQYRRTSSDSAKKASQPANKKSNVVKNGPLSPASSSPSTPLISPSPSPRSSIGSAGPSPASSVTSLNKDSKVTGGSIPRRPRTVDKNSTSSTSRTTTSNVSRPSTTSTVQSTRTTSRTALNNTATKKNHITAEEEFKQKHAQLKSQTQTESQKAKSHLESSRQRAPTSSTVPRSSTSNLSKRGGTVLTNSTMKVIESYKDNDPNYTMRRQLEHEQGEAKQLDCLRRTIEGRLKVTLPDNLPETLRDGVLLCQLANSIRARSVTSIHVPSPAVPKLTMAKCRKNVENFIDACRKLGVHREQICGAQDILEEKGVSRLAVTVAALAAVSSNPRSSAV